MTIRQISVFIGNRAGSLAKIVRTVGDAGINICALYVSDTLDYGILRMVVDDTPREVIQGRFDRLAALVAELAWKANQVDLGGISEVLVEGPSKRDAAVLVGHSAKNQTVHLRAPEGVEPLSLVGELCDVRVREARTWYLRGEMVGDPR